MTRKAAHARTRPHRIGARARASHDLMGVWSCVRTYGQKSENVDLGRGGADGGSDSRSAEQQRALVGERALPRARSGGWRPSSNTVRMWTTSARRGIGARARVAAAARRGAAHAARASRDRAERVGRRGRAREDGLGHGHHGVVVVHVYVQQHLDAARGCRDHGRPAGRWTRGERARRDGGRRAAPARAGRRRGSTR